jgi:hypothetical protein
MQNICVIGGGFFGAYIAHSLASAGHQVTLYEKEKDFMQHASYVNQARVHNGYHYPRSILTAARSHSSFTRFCQEFPETIVNEFAKYYLIGKVLGKVTAKQYQHFCRRIGIPCETAPKWVQELVNPQLIEQVFATVEYAFDAVKLKNILKTRLEDTRIQTWLETTVTHIAQSATGGLTVTFTNADGVQQQRFDQVFNCTYSLLNYVIHNSGYNVIPLKHELTEMCLVKVPELLQKTGLTVMCGPFFSTMPFPPAGLHSFSHVRYTPHYEWLDTNAGYINAHQHLSNAKKHSAWEQIIHDAARYIPLLKECQYRDSLWEIKTVLPRSETDDSRPILFKQDYGLKGFHCIMGGKIDNIYDAVAIIDKLV